VVDLEQEDEDLALIVVAAAKAGHRRRRRRLLIPLRGRHRFLLLVAVARRVQLLKDLTWDVSSVAQKAIVILHIVVLAGMMQ